MLDALFADLALGFSEQFAAPYVAAEARWKGTPTLDAGGSISAPGMPVVKTCKAQVSAPTEAMRSAEGFRQTDMRIMVLAATLDGALDTDARIVIASGVHAGTWELLSATLDTAGIGWACAGRKVA